ncbi:peptidylprolyl isomerase [Tessaracoccus sp. OS52]|uniref:peptidylprolyl isomerase n=1 Tax=Tessaracoccus sp. OS52 TaxID=2886691 RepID=UPI001D12C6D7|nr:peptidylprolyl isomerase [Tessaracoccus sp. OS52]
MPKKLSCLAALFAVAALSGCADANQSTDPGGVRQATTCEYPGDGEPARPVDPPATTDVPNSGEVSVTLHLTAGDVMISMDRAKAPCTINSFLSLAEQGFFDDTDCHRLVDTGIFILQCGDPTGTGTGGPGYVMDEELEQTTEYPAGSVAMAKRQQPGTSGSQFFLVWADTPLPPEYTVFGTMDQAGLDVVGGIAAQGVAAEDGMSPIAEAHIDSVTLG